MHLSLLKSVSDFSDYIKQKYMSLGYYRFLSVAESAKLLGISRQKMYNEINAGNVRVFDNGKKVIPPEELIIYIESHLHPKDQLGGLL